MFNEFADMFWFLAFIVAPILVGIGLTVLLGRAALDLFRRYMLAQEDIRERQLETARKGYHIDLVEMRADRGQVPRAMLDQPALVEQQFALMAAHVDAQRTHAPVPHSLTYSPSYAPHQAYRNDVQALGGDVSPTLTALSAPPPADFWTLYHQDKLPAQGFLMGYGLDNNQPVIADWRKLYSALVGGQSGSGKSTLIRCILAQAALQGGRFVVIDPHYGAGEESLAESLQPLQGLMQCEPAATDAQIRDSLAYIESVGRARLAGKEKDHSPLILIVDELTALLMRGAVGNELLATLGLISQECRKVGVFCLASGQQFQSAVMSTDVRNSFVSYISCRSRRDTARVMSGSTEFAKIAEGLTIGQAVWMSPAGDVERLAVPNCTERHLMLVAKQMESGLYTVDQGSAMGSAVGPRGLLDVDFDGDAGEAEPIADTTLEPTSAKVATVRQMLKRGAPHPQIIAEVWGVNPGSKRPYRRARAEFEAIVNSLTVEA